MRGGTEEKLRRATQSSPATHTVTCSRHAHDHASPGVRVAKEKKKKTKEKKKRKTLESGEGWGAERRGTSFSRKRASSRVMTGGQPNRNVQRFRGGLVFTARRLLFHSTLGLRVIKKKKDLFFERAGEFARHGGRAAERHRRHTLSRTPGMSTYEYDNL